MTPRPRTGPPPRLALALALAPALSLGACSVFDARLYMNRDAGTDGSTDAFVGPTVTLADQCSGNVPVVSSSAVAFLVDTTSLSDSFNDFGGCVGHSLPGADGFFAVDMQAGERWHFHVKVSETTADPAVYVLPSCDERSCGQGTAIDECGVGRDEHVSFFPRTGGRYIVGVDSARSGAGSIYQVVAIHPVCGNGGMPEHSESCDDGNMRAGDGCSATCQAELSGSAAREAEPNDDLAGANLLMIDGTAGGAVTVRGRLGGRCDFDMYQFTVPEGAAVTATMLDTSGQACGASAPDLRLALVENDGRTERGFVQTAAGSACPAIGAGQTFAQHLTTGTYYVRATAPETSPGFDYQLTVQVVPP